MSYSLSSYLFELSWADPALSIVGGTNPPGTYDFAKFPLVRELYAGVPPRSANNYTGLRKRKIVISWI